MLEVAEVMQPLDIADVSSSGEEVISSNPTQNVINIDTNEVKEALYSTKKRV